jgi:Na+-driven multidrug efflux pump
MASATALVWAVASIVLAPFVGSVVASVAPRVLTIRLVRLAAVVHVLDALQAVLSFTLRGVGDARVPAAITAFAYGVVGPAVVVGLVVVGGAGPEGVWLALAVSLSVTVLGFAMRWRRVVRMRAVEAGHVASA